MLEELCVVEDSAGGPKKEANAMGSLMTTPKLTAVQSQSFMASKEEMKCASL